MVSNKLKKIFFFDSRATYAYSKNVIKQIHKFKKLKYNTIVSGTYLDKRFGNISKNFKIDNIKIGKKLNLKLFKKNLFMVT